MILSSTVPSSTQQLLPSFLSLYCHLPRRSRYLFRWFTTIYKQNVLSTFLVTSIPETKLRKHHDKCNASEVKPLARNCQGVSLIFEWIEVAEATHSAPRFPSSSLRIIISTYKTVIITNGLEILKITARCENESSKPPGAYRLFTLSPHTVIWPLAYHWDSFLHPLKQDHVTLSQQF